MYTNRVEKIASLEEMLNADVYFLVHNRRSDGAIDGTMIDVLRKMIRFTKRREKAALVIQTPGGYADEAYYIGEFFREYYDNTEAYVVSDCYSGGTMIALSTDKIYLSHSGCLGPIDIQRYYGDDDKDNWYPAPSGLIEALKKARENNEIDENLEKTFKGKMSILATYFKDKYTYVDLVGENVKRHCFPFKDWNDVWKYLSVLNFSHGTPLTYRRLKEIGLDVSLMSDDIEESIKYVIRDIEHEFGDLVEKDYLYDFFKNPINVKIAADEDEEKENEPNKHDYRIGTNSEKLAVIETSVMGFMQSREIGMMFEDFVPKYMSAISSGWEEEENKSNITDEEQDKLDIIVSFIAEAASQKTGVDLNSLDDFTRQQFLDSTYYSLIDMAFEQVSDTFEDLEDIPNGDATKIVVNYLISNPDIIVFDDKIEEILKKFSEINNIDYSNIGGADKLELYDELCYTYENLMLAYFGIDGDEYDKLPELEKAEMLNEFILTADIDFEKKE